MAGLDWSGSFIKHHSELSLRKPQTIWDARAVEFNKVVVTQLFNLLTRIVDEHHLTAMRLASLGANVNHSKKKKQKGFEDELSVKAWAEVHDSGWMTVEIFEKWFTKFKFIQIDVTEKDIASTTTTELFQIQSVEPAPTTIDENCHGQDLDIHALTLEADAVNAMQLFQPKPGCS
ncbi:hypothetical protein ILUMI_18574 [Ignelater luminosus]|uniref:Uncharacterized protein n=1 Tax=Ignelater luminosus TaxID=2038154 RepID=A0A8K0CJN4_IGNLU|nr:hypothetical protein ILUMI_18574 [Ignelater luminosus]